MPYIHRHSINNVLGVIMTVMLSMSLWSCKSEGDAPAMKDPQRSVYYWRTTFSLNDSEKSFLNTHNIKRIYLHVFDVIKKGGKPTPDATLVFNEQPPREMEIVPVVFITNDVITADADDINTPAEQIVRRVKQMMDAHKISWKELQIDFDWTQRNQQVYYSMLSKMREMLKADNRGLSATIRLHQLAMVPPPVDYGALMVYNIGNYSKADEQNSIISVDNLKPYLRHLAGYKLPLATALPIYSWDLVFLHDEFVGIARGLNLSDTTRYSRIPESKKGELYMVKTYHTATNGDVTLMQPGIKLTPGTIIRHEQSSYDVLKEVRDMLSHERQNALDEVILYHLENKNINKYSNEQIETLLGSH